MIKGEVGVKYYKLANFASSMCMTNNYLVGTVCTSLIVLDIFILTAILQYLYIEQNKLVATQGANLSSMTIGEEGWQSKVGQSERERGNFSVTLLEKRLVVDPTLLGLSSSTGGGVDRGHNLLFRSIKQCFSYFLSFKTLLFSWVVNIYSRFQERLRSLPLEWKGMMSLGQAHTVTSFVFGALPDKSLKINPQYKTIGIYHVVSASGYNLSLILSSFAFLSRGKNTFTRGIINFMMVWIYVTCCGFSPSITRAGCMASVMIVSQLLHKQYHALRALGATVVCVALFQQAWITSLSFQLSAAATLALIVWLRSNPDQLTATLGTRTSSSFINQLFNTQIKAVFLSTLAIQTTTLPLILDSFGSWPIVTLIANPLLLWLTPVVTILGLWYIVLSLVIMQLGFGEWIGWLWRWWIGLPLRVVLDSFEHLVDVIADHSFGMVLVPDWSKWHWIFWIVAVSGLWLWVKNKQRTPRIVSVYEA